MEDRAFSNNITESMSSLAQKARVAWRQVRLGRLSRACPQSSRHWRAAADRRAVERRAVTRSS